MDEESLNQHLSQIATQWTLVFQAHAGEPTEVTRAQQLLILRYAGAVYRYLFRVLGDPHAADDLAQEFAYRFIRGDFRRADPDRGRFRDFVKTAVRNLLIDYQRHRHRRTQPVHADELELAAPTQDADELDRQFIESWRSELLSRAWNAIAEYQQQTGRPYHAVLQVRARHPDARSTELAQELSTQMGKQVSADWVRQALHRAREKFAELILAELAASYPAGAPTREAVEEELIELGLLECCRPALEDRSFRE